MWELRVFLWSLGSWSYSSHPLPPERTGHGCTVGVNRDPPVWPFTQTGKWKWQGADLTFVGRRATTCYYFEETWIVAVCSCTPPRPVRVHDLVDPGSRSTFDYWITSSTSSFMSFSLMLGITPSTTVLSAAWDLLDSFLGAEAVQCTGLLHVISVRLQTTIHCKKREKEWNTPNSGNAEHSANDANVLEPLARLLWLFPVTAHGETQEESPVVRGFLNRHQRGVVRGDATSVIESLGAAERPTRTEAHWSLMHPDTDMHCVHVFRTLQESDTTSYHCWSLVFAWFISLSISLPRMMVSHNCFTFVHNLQLVFHLCLHWKHALSQLVVSPPGSVDSTTAGICLDSSSSFLSTSTTSCASWCTWAISWSWQWPMNSPLWDAYPWQSPPHKKESNVGRPCLRSRYRWNSFLLCWCQNWLCSAGNCFRQHPRTAIVRVRTSMLITSSELSVSTADATLQFSVPALVSASFDSALRHASGSEDVRFPVVIGLVKLLRPPTASAAHWARVYCGCQPGPTRVTLHPNKMVEIPERKPYIRWTTYYDVLRFRRDVDCRRVFLHDNNETRTLSWPGIWWKFDHELWMDQNVLRYPFESDCGQIIRNSWSFYDDLWLLSADENDTVPWSNDQKGKNKNVFYDLMFYLKKSTPTCRNLQKMERTEQLFPTIHRIRRIVWNWFTSIEILTHFQKNLKTLQMNPKQCVKKNHTHVDV